MGGCQGVGGWRGMDWEFGLRRCKLVYIGWMIKKILLSAQGTLFNIF